MAMLCILCSLLRTLSSLSYSHTHIHSHHTPGMHLHLHMRLLICSGALCFALF